MERFQWLPEQIHRRHQAHVIQFDLFVEGCLSYDFLKNDRTSHGFDWARTKSRFSGVRDVIGVANER
jgi:hypothetical protein